MAFKQIQAQEDVSPNLIPMIDIMFLLLLFFMLNADMSQREMEEITPPIAKHSIKDEPQPGSDRITVNVHHDIDDPKNPKCPPFVNNEVCRNDAHWHISMSGRRYEFTKAGMDSLAKALFELGKARIEQDEIKASARTLIIRADRTAPYKLVNNVIQAATAGRIYKIEIGAGKPKEELNK